MNFLDCHDAIDRLGIENEQLYEDLQEARRALEESERNRDELEDAVMWFVERVRPIAPCATEKFKSLPAIRRLYE